MIRHALERVSLDIVTFINGLMTSCILTILTTTVLGSVTLKMCIKDFLIKVLFINFTIILQNFEQTPSDGEPTSS